MDQQEGLSSGNLFKWDPRGTSSSSVAPAGAGGGGGMMTPSQYQYQYQYQQQQQMMHHMLQGRAGAGGSSTTQVPPPQGQGLQGGLGGLEELFQAYGIRYYTASKIAELGFTANTLLDMREEELDDMINSLSHLFRWDLLVGERYGIKAAVRAERRRLHDLDYSSALRGPSATHPLDAFSQEGISEERAVQQGDQIEVVRSGGGPASWGDILPIHQAQRKKPIKQHPRPKQRSVTKKQLPVSPDNDDDDDDDDDTDGPAAAAGPSCVTERQREHPFIVTEPGEVARGKKNGLDYLFHLYELCHDFLIQVQNLAKDCGDKCPTKVTNQVFRYAKKAGATYINKPKMRHYVHCYALHCLDEDTSNALRRAFKERGENVGAWRQACYKPLVSIAARQASWDIDSIFNAHPRLSIWYVPTKLRQLCHAERSAAAAAASANSTLSIATTHLLPF